MKHSPIKVFKGNPPRPITPPQAKPPEDVGFWRFKPTAKWLDISERSLSEEVRLGHIRVARFGRSLRFDPVDVRAFAEARKSGGTIPVKEGGA